MLKKHKFINFNYFFQKSSESTDLLDTMS